MTKDQIRLAQRYIAKENQKFTAEFVSIAESEWPAERDPRVKYLSVWRNRDFLVQVVNEFPPGITRLSVNRTRITKTADYVDGITWDELQRIKSAVGFGHMDAVEIYPPDKDVVNVANIRHLWIMDKPLEFGWRKK